MAVGDDEGRDRVDTAFAGVDFATGRIRSSVNIPLEEALDLGWEILSECFEPNETGLKSDLIRERWPKRDAVE